MTAIRTVCVYCGSSSNVDNVYKKAAAEMGPLCAAQGWNMVYGGAAVGLMGVAARSALENGVKVTGVIPEDLKVREVEQPGLAELHVTSSMHERQMKMIRLSDAFIALPGGLGTLAEFFEILTWRQLRFHQKPIVLLNAHNYWDRLLDVIDKAADSGFMRAEDKDLFQVAKEAAEIPGILGALAPHREEVETGKM